MSPDVRSNVSSCWLLAAGCGVKTGGEPGAEYGGVVSEFVGGLVDGHVTVADVFLHSTLSRNATEIAKNSDR
ncbi:hypothetical protein K9909_003067 [Salmonella enterica subsp. enterica serovar Newport]|nr:hypothetical protein [Salmonella enterica subsp. enterica serovar Newport]EHS5152784.1 hypothetical protein [Salmonella enterica subsp. enterica serovar Newport]EHV5816154.1 hypothetical protein [Salmonella enterica subsp. enterica serovar Newport]EIC3608327.1 hypothetical protein [Salmonella enterica subsp. enterica serovar Newport]EJB3598441.1 hypothetical protein [Salmonella enterica subsp. enterica serovar Newport]